MTGRLDARPVEEGVGKRSSLVAAVSALLSADENWPIAAQPCDEGLRLPTYDRRSAEEEARRDLAAWIAKWSGRYTKLVAWTEEAIEETAPFTSNINGRSTPGAARWCRRQNVLLIRSIVGTGQPHLLEAVRCPVAK